MGMLMIARVPGEAVEIGSDLAKGADAKLTVNRIACVGADTRCAVKRVFFQLEIDGINSEIACNVRQCISFNISPAIPVRLYVSSVRGGQVHVGLDAPRQIRILREEIAIAMRGAQAPQAPRAAVSA